MIRRWVGVQRRAQRQLGWLLHLRLVGAAKGLVGSAVGSVPLPTALGGSLHTRNDLLPHRRVCPPGLARRCLLLTHNRISRRRPEIGDHFFTACGIGPPGLCGLTYLRSAGLAIERGSPLRRCYGVGPSRLRGGALSLTHFRSDDPRGLAHSFGPENCEGDVSPRLGVRRYRVQP